MSRSNHYKASTIIKQRSLRKNSCKIVKNANPTFSFYKGSQHFTKQLKQATATIVFPRQAICQKAEGRNIGNTKCTSCKQY